VAWRIPRKKPIAIMESKPIIIKNSFPSHF
jgi:hypothetical protein